MSRLDEVDMIFHWDKVMQNAWGAVPALDLLSPLAPFWSSMHLQGMQQNEVVTFGLIGRLLKYSQSVGVALPLFGADSITRLITYLHRLRFDAMEGGLRTPWLNSVNMENRPDVIFFSRPSARFHELSRISDIHARIIRLGGSHSTSLGNCSQTILLDGACDVMDLIDLVEKETRPFVLVIDATVCGTSRAEMLDASLAECFSDIPRIVLMSLGDGETIGRLRASSSNTHIWEMRIGDQRLIDPLSTPSWQMGLGQIDDQTADAEFRLAFGRFLELRRDLEKSKDTVLKQKLAVLGKVLRSLNELVVPLDRLEETLIKATRPGMFPIRCLSRWLEIAEQETCKYGETQAKIDILARQLGSLHELLRKSVTGKAEALLTKLKAPRIKEQPIMVLCSTSHEALALESWLDDSLETDWIESIYIVAMDGVKTNRQQHKQVHEVIITGALWPSRQHWLATPCQLMIIFAYPYEIKFIERQIANWQALYFNASITDGDKCHLWSLNWTQGTRCLDIGSNNEKIEVNTEVLCGKGQYPQYGIKTTIPIELSMDDWLDLLIADPIEPDTSASEGDALNKDLMWIETEEHEHYLPWIESHPVLVLKDNDIVPTLPEFLKEDDQIILLKHTNERIATQEKLFELLVAESEGLQQFIKVADRWQVLVDKVAKKYRPYQVQPHLCKEGVKVGDAAIARWYKHGVYGPRDRIAVVVFARLAGENEPEKIGKYIANGIEQVRIAHQHIGKQLRKALLERGKGASEITIGSMTLDMVAFDDMIEICTVKQIIMPVVQVVATIKAASMQRISEDICNKYPGRLFFTPPAQKSMRSSAYRDMDKFQICLELMATNLYDHYRYKKTRMHEVLLKFTAVYIEFEPMMSSVTMGRFGGNTQYKNRNVDMNKHFCLGNARDKTRTLRIHFEWDEEENIIVIHHAGEHLTTSQT